MIVRIHALQKKIPSGTAWLISDQIAIEYLTGFVSLLPTEREAFLWLTNERAWLMHAAFSPAPPSEDITYLIGSHSSQLAGHIRSICQEYQPQVLVVDAQTLWLNEWNTIKKSTDQLGVTLITDEAMIGHTEHKAEADVENRADALKMAQLPQMAPNDTIRRTIYKQRMIKDGIELHHIKAAGAIVSQALQQLRQEVAVGMTEQFVCQRLEVIMRELGSIQPAFPTIVAFGSNTALPHHQPTTLRLEENMPILIDCGATVDRYRSDMTRSWWFGDSPDPEYQTIEAIVLDAYQAGIMTLNRHFTVDAITQFEVPLAVSPDDVTDSIQSNLTAGELDASVRNVINQSGYGQHFIHTTGHGLGLEIHESPSISQGNPVVLSAGMAITVEPGIYLLDQFGCRHEDTLLLDLPLNASVTKLV